MKILDYYKKIPNKKSGFTILETLFAVFILMLSITGPMVFAQSGLRASFQARDQITGFFLAQDVIETIKNVRDDNGIDGDAWLSGLVGASNCDGNNPCFIETTTETPSVSICPGGTCQPLKIDSNGKYGYATGDESRFTRTVYISQLNNNEAAVVVEVEWTSPVSLGRHRIVVQENIYSWIPGI